MTVPAPFTTDGTHRAASVPFTLTVAEVLAASTPRAADEPPLTLRVTADGYLIALVDGDTPTVTAWTGEGQGARHGRPERWRQNYFREFEHSAAAQSRFTDLVEKHRGPAEGADQ